MQLAQATIDLGRLTCCRKQHDLKLRVSVEASFTSTTLDSTALQRQLSLLIDNNDCKALYIDRSSQLCVIFDIEHEKCTDAVKALLPRAELWSQLRWECVSIEEEQDRDAITTIRCSFTNDEQAGDQRPKLHRIDQDVPFHHVKATACVATALLSSVRYRIQSDDEQDVECGASAPEPLTYSSESQPVEDVQKELWTSSPLLATTRDDTSLLDDSSEAFDMSSSPPTSGNLDEAASNSLIVPLLDAALRSSMQKGFRLPKGVSILGDMLPLGEVAPSTFMPGFAAAMAYRASFISRISAALGAGSPRDRPEQQQPAVKLWNKMQHQLRAKHQKIRLKALTPQSSAVVFESSDSVMLSGEPDIGDVMSQEIDEDDPSSGYLLEDGRSDIISPLHT